MTAPLLLNPASYAAPFPIRKALLDSLTSSSIPTAPAPGSFSPMHACPLSPVSMRTSLMSCAPAFSTGSLSSMARAMETPSLMTCGTPNLDSSTTFRPAQRESVLLSQTWQSVWQSVPCHVMGCHPGISGSASAAEPHRAIGGRDHDPPRGPSVTATASATLLMPICNLRRDSPSNTISLASDALTTCGNKDAIQPWRRFCDVRICGYVQGGVAMRLGESQPSQRIGFPTQLRANELRCAADWLTRIFGASGASATLRDDCILAEGRVRKRKTFSISLSI